MYHCSKDVIAFHDEKVTLLQGAADRNARPPQRQPPAPDEVPQRAAEAGSGRVHQAGILRDDDDGSGNPDNDYDIDDGVYFVEKDLKDKDSNALSPLQVREMVRDVST